MRVTRVDDYQSWLIELGQQRLLIDPWLTDAFSLPLGAWFFGRQHREPPAFTPDTAPALDRIVLTAHFEDHLDIETLQRLPKTVPVAASKAAAKIVRGLGFAQVDTLMPGDDIQLDGGHRLTAVAPAFPYRHNALGFLFEEARGARTYLETHVADLETVRALAPVDLAILPVQSVRLFGIQFAMDAQRAAEVARAVQAKAVTPTGLDPAVAEGWFARWVLRCRGTVDDFSRRLQGDADPRFLSLATGEAADIIADAVQTRPPSDA